MSAFSFCCQDLRKSKYKSHKALHEAREENLKLIQSHQQLMQFTLQHSENLQSPLLTFDYIDYKHIGYRDIIVFNLELHSLTLYVIMLHIGNETK